MSRATIPAESALLERWADLVDRWAEEEGVQLPGGPFVLKEAPATKRNTQQPERWRALRPLIQRLLDLTVSAHNAPGASERAEAVDALVRLVAGQLLPALHAARAPRALQERVLDAMNDLCALSAEEAQIVPRVKREDALWYGGASLASSK